MTRVESFAPILGRAPRVLILGSMPSERSLQERQYYGHPRNAFWWIMGELFWPGAELEYAARVRRLRAAGVAVWDVLRRCERPGSLDGDIVRSTEEPNDLPGLLERRRSIGAVFFNGAKAEDAWDRHVAPALELGRPLRLARLPSTSPANASLTRARKLSAWRAVALEAARGRGPGAPTS